MSQDVDALRSGILGRDPGDNAAERKRERERERKRERGEGGREREREGEREREREREKERNRPRPGLDRINVRGCFRCARYYYYYYYHHHHYHPRPAYSIRVLRFLSGEGIAGAL